MVANPIILISSTETAAPLFGFILIVVHTDGLPWCCQYMGCCW